MRWLADAEEQDSRIQGAVGVSGMNYADLDSQPYRSNRVAPIMPTSRNGKALLCTLLAGRRLTPLISPQFCGIVALSQEVGRLKKLGWPVKTRRLALGGGKSVSEYWL